MNLKQYLKEFKDNDNGGGDFRPKLEDRLWEIFKNGAAIEEEKNFSIKTSTNSICKVDMLWCYHGKKSIASFGKVHKDVMFISIGMDTIPLKKSKEWDFDAYESTFKDLVGPAVHDYYSSVNGI